ncbi:MAG: outer membrane protein assembly factor BamB family protein [Planctomycetota bacterium]
MRTQTFFRSLAAGLVLLLAAAAAPGRAGEPPKPADRNFRFLALADTHFWELEKYPKGLEGFKVWLERVKPLGADFAVVLGDVCGDRYAALAQVRKIAEESGFKVYFLPGNHDDAYGNRPEHWKKAFGAFYHSFDHKGWHFVSHWSQKAQPEWLSKDLAGVKPGTPIIFWQHYGLRHNPGIWKLLEKHKVVMGMYGHTHGLRTGMSGGLRDVNLNTFGSGFAVVDVLKDKRIAIDWRPPGVSKRLVIEHPGEGDQVAAAEQKILVTAFDSCRDVVSVEYNAGAGWKKLEKVTGRSWTAAERLRGGAVQVRARDSAGEEWKAACRFTVGRKAEVRPGADWPVWGGTPDNRRCAKERLAPPLQLAWHAPVGGRPSHPVLAGGKLYVSSASQDFEESNALVCLDAASGRELWRAKLVSNPMGPPAVSGNVIGVVDGHGRGYGFDAAGGRELWRVKGLSTYGSYGHTAGITAADGVFLAGNAQALDVRTGKKLWAKNSPLSQSAIRPPAVAGGMAVGAGTGWQRCLEVKTGKEVWKSTPSSYRATTALNGTFLLGGRNLVNAADGKSIRRYKLSTGSDGAVTPDGKVFITGNHPGRVYAYALEDGALRWSFPKSGKYHFGATTVAGDHAWLWGPDGFLRALSVKTGEEVWKRRFGSRLSGAVISGNALFVAGDDGCVYALTGR